MADIAAQFTHMGPAGSGLVAKMINQLIVGCAHAVMAEALLLAEAPASTLSASRNALPAATPTARCCRSFIRAWWRAISSRRVMRGSC